MIGVFSPTALDLVVLAVGLTWLLMRPGLGPVVLLGAYQCIVFVINLVAFFGAEVGSQVHRALLVHLIFRVLAVVLMVTGLLDVRRRSALSVEQPLAAESTPPSW